VNNNYSKLILTAADYKCVLSVPTQSGVKTFNLVTLQEVGWRIKRDIETIYQVGINTPYGIQSHNVSYEGYALLQAGELLSILALSGLSETTQIQGAVLAIAGAVGGFSRSFGGINFSAEEFTLRARDKDSKINAPFVAASVT